MHKGVIAAWADRVQKHFASYAQTKQLAKLEIGVQHARRLLDTVPDYNHKTGSLPGNR